MLQKKQIFVIIAIMAEFSILIALAGATDTLTIEADINDVGTQGNGTNGTGTVSIQVPDFIDLGEIDEDGLSEELKIYVNNTGNEGITVTPTLIDYSDDIFTNLFFREFKTSGGQTVTPIRIGSWNFNISAPSSGQSFRAKYFYMRLDLSDADIDLSSDLNGHRANVKFIATSQ